MPCDPLQTLGFLVMVANSSIMSCRDFTILVYLFFMAAVGNRARLLQGSL